MKQFILNHKVFVVAAMLLTGLIAMSQDKPLESLGAQRPQDTTLPRSHKLKLKELDRLAQELDMNMLHVREQIRDIDMDMIHKQVELSLEKIDIDKILKDVELTLKNIDLENLLADVKLQLDENEWKEKEGEIKKALENAHVELEKAKLEIKSIDMDKIRRELEAAKQDLEKTRIELKNMDIDKITDDARKEIQSAKGELKLLKEMFMEMKKDGLVDSKGEYKIEYKNKELYINGKKQSQQITDKYRRYIKGEHFEITIEE